jgi:hypothetical protein
VFWDGDADWKDMMLGLDGDGYVLTGECVSQYTRRVACAPYIRSSRALFRALFRAQGIRQTRLRAYLGARVLRLGACILAPFTRSWVHDAVCLGSFVS